MATDPVLLHITAASHEEALSISQELLSVRLVACANIIGHVTSMYWWQGQIEHAAEVMIIAKTKASLVDEVTARVTSLHSYNCPCVISTPIEGGNPDFLDWIARETHPAT